MYNAVQFSLRLPRCHSSPLSKLYLLCKSNDCNAVQGGGGQPKGSVFLFFFFFFVHLNKLCSYWRPYKLYETLAPHPPMDSMRNHCYWTFTSIIFCLIMWFVPVDASCWWTLLCYFQVDQLALCCVHAYKRLFLLLAKLSSSLPSLKNELTRPWNSEP